MSAAQNATVESPADSARTRLRRLSKDGFQRAGDRSRALIRQSPFGAACLLAAVLPVAFAVWFVQGFSLIAPSMDHWTLLPFFSALASGDFHPMHYLSPHNGLHIATFLKFIMAVLAVITSWSLRAEIYLGFVFILYTAFILDRAFKESGAFGRETRCVMALFTIALLFSPALDWLWTWGIGFFHIFQNACVATTVWALARTRPSIGIAILGAVGATFSRFEGVFSWIVFFPALLAASARTERPRRAWISWVAAAAVSMAIFAALMLHGGELGLGRGGHVGLAPRLKMAASVIGISAGLFTESSRGSVLAAYWPAGVAVLAIFAAVSIRLFFRSSDLRSKALPWIGFGGFGLVFAVMAGAARQQEVEARVLYVYLSAYSATGSPVTIAAIHLVALALADYRPPFGLSAATARRAAALLGIGVLMLNYGHALPRLSARRSEGHWDRYCVELGDYLTDRNSCFKVPQRWQALKRSGFVTPAQDLRFDVASPFGRIEGVAPGTDPMSGASVAIVSGWAALSDDDAGTVVLAYGDDQRFRTVATQLSPRDGGVHWVVKVSWSVGAADSRPLRAWAYDKRAKCFRRLEGEARLDTLSARQRAGIGQGLPESRTSTVADRGRI